METTERITMKELIRARIQAQKDFIKERLPLDRVKDDYKRIHAILNSETVLTPSNPKDYAK